MNTRLNEINDAFKKRGILLKQAPDETKTCIMQESVTNQFMKVEDITGGHYLIRLNGKLWPPFTREGEHVNLMQLKNNQINTTVIVNNYQSGFQICRLNEENTKFTALTADKKQASLNKIATNIKKFHNAGNFENHYSIVDTIHHSLKRLPQREQTALNLHHPVILMLLKRLFENVGDLVSSHNDLLPSSVYVSQGEVSLVDWEYSAKNHFSYDLALFSIKSSLSKEEEQQLTVAYDPIDELDARYAVAMMKPVVNFLLLLWNVSAKQPNAVAAQLLFYAFEATMRDVIYQQAARGLLSGAQCSLFHAHKKAIELDVTQPSCEMRL